MDLGAIDTRRYFVAVGLFLAVLFTLLGPEGSADGGMHLRFAQWLLQVAVPLSLLVATHLLLSRLAAFDHLNPWLKLTLSGVGGGVLFSPLALMLDFAFGVDDWDILADRQALLALWLDEIGGVVPPVTLVWVGINAPRLLGLDFRRDHSEAPRAVVASPPTPADTSAVATGFRKLLPPQVGGDIVYLMSELHYLRVVTRRGRALVLYNLRDAIDELPADSGIQTHRSFWVAFAQVDRLARYKGAPVVRMSDGSVIPISRRRLATVRQALEQVSTGRTGKKMERVKGIEPSS